MPRELALAVCGLFVLWLFIRARKTCPMTSRVLWVPFLWIMIIGSRSVSSWFSGGTKIELPENLEGNPFDRNVYLALIIAGFLVLLARRVNWGRIFASNRWVFLFFIYFGISVIWSDYPFVSLKRWVKDVGNIVMILIILTETAPFQAIKAVFFRYAFVAIPFSVLLILYFPDIGMYGHTSWDPSQPGNLAQESLYCGIADNKNGLGCIAFICGLFLVWDFIESRAAQTKKSGVTDAFSRAVLVTMVIWLIIVAHSVTSILCLLLGAGILLSLRLPFARRQVRHLGAYSLAAVLLIFAVYAVPGILEAIVGTVGRDLTLTGRTDIWTDVLRVPINPAIGTGYESFWMGSWVKPLWEKYTFHPNQAHNGYLETYLNGGLVGIFLLLALIVATGGKLKRALMDGRREGELLFSFFVAILFYNWTEASFDGLNILWFILLLIALSYPHLTLKPAVNPRRACIQ